MSDKHAVKRYHLPSFSVNVVVANAGKKKKAYLVVKLNLQSKKTTRAAEYHVRLFFFFCFTLTADSFPVVLKYSHSSPRILIDYWGQVMRGRDAKCRSECKWHFYVSAPNQKNILKNWKIWERKSELLNRKYQMEKKVLHFSPFLLPNLSQQNNCYWTDLRKENWLRRCYLNFY